MELKPSHEMFVQTLIKNGGHQTEAYMEVYKAKYDTARHGGSILLRNVEVRRRVSELLESQGLGIVELNKKLKILTNAQKGIVCGGYLQYPSDNIAQLEALKLAYKLHGLIGSNMGESEIFVTPEHLTQLAEEQRPKIEEEI